MDNDHKDMLYALERIQDVKQSVDVRHHVEHLTAKELRDAAYVEQLVDHTEPEQYASQDADELWDSLQEQVSRNVMDEVYWMIPVLDAASPYEEIVEEESMFRTAAELIVNPQAVSLQDTPEDELTKKTDKAPGYTWAHGKTYHSDELYSTTNLKKRDPQISESYFVGENLFRNTEKLTLYASYLSGENLLKNTEQVKIQESILEGDHVLRNSDDIDITASLMYGTDALRHVGSYQVTDSIIVGDAPLGVETPKEDRDTYVLNSVIVGDRPLDRNTSATIENSVIVAEQRPQNDRIYFKNSILMTPDMIEYCEDGELRFHDWGVVRNEENDATELVDSLFEGIERLNDNR